MLARLRRRSMLLRVSVLAVGCALLSAGSTSVKADDVLYTITDLGSLGGCCANAPFEGAAAAINNLGDVVGTTTSTVDPNTLVPFVYQNGTMTAIGTQPGWASGINDAGQITGSVYGGSVSTPDYSTINAFLYQAGALTNLGALPGEGFGGSLGNAINAAGVVVGTSKAQAFIYQDGIMRGLHRRTAYQAYGINDAGDVVGALENVSPLTHAFLFSGNNLIDLGTLDNNPDGASVAVQINAHQQIVGYGWIDSNSLQRAFLWDNGVMRDIGTLAGGYAWGAAINNLGHIVGVSDASVFLYRDSAMIDLNHAIAKDASGVWPKILAVSGINDRGQIVGSAMFNTPDGVFIRPCLLTPIAPQPR